MGYLSPFLVSAWWFALRDFHPSLEKLRIVLILIVTASRGRGCPGQTLPGGHKTWVCLCLFAIHVCRVCFVLEFTALPSTLRTYHRRALPPNTGKCPRLTVSQVSDLSLKCINIDVYVRQVLKPFHTQ